MSRPGSSFSDDPRGSVGHDEAPSGCADRASIEKCSLCSADRQRKYYEYYEPDAALSRNGHDAAIGGESAEGCGMG